MKKFNYIFSAVMIVLCAAAIGVASTYPKHPMSEGYGAGFYPTLIAALIIVLCVVLIIQTALNKAVAAGEVKGLDWKTLRRPLFFIFCMGLFALLLKYLGLLLDSFVFVTLTMLSMEVKWWKALIIAAIAAVVMFVGFEVLLDVPFPAGVIFGG